MALPGRICAFALMSGLVQVLIACAHPDARKAAEAQLVEAERGDAAQFVLACAQVLRDPQGPPYARHLAGILLKNAVAAGESSARDHQLTARWLAIPQEVRAQVRSATLEALVDPADQGARRAAALCVARIGTIELPRSSWPELVPGLVSRTQPDQPPEQASDAMRALGLLADEWWSHCVRDFDVRRAAEQILVAAVQALSASPPTVRVAAARTLHSVLPFTGFQQMSEAECGVVLRATLQNCSPAAPDELRTEALRCLSKCATERHAQLHLAVDEIAVATVGAFTTAVEPVAIEAIEVWTALAEHELALPCSNLPAGGPHQVCSRALPAILPALLEALARGPRDRVDEDEGFELSEAASACLVALARATADACVGTVVAFLEANLQAPDQGRRRAAMLAFGSIQDGPSAVALGPLVGPMLPRLLEGFMHGVFPVANAAAWALGRCLEMNPAAFPDSAQATLFEVCVARLRKDDRIAVEACYCLEGLVDQQASTLPVEIFEPVTKVLVETGTLTRSPQARGALMGSLTELVSRASEECVPHMDFILVGLLGWAESSGGAQVPDQLVRCLRALTARSSCEKLMPHGERMLALYMKASQGHFELYGGFDEETLRASGSLAKVLGPKFEAGLPAFWPVLKAAVEMVADYQACHAGLLALRDVIEALGPAMSQCAPDCLGALGTVLRAQETPDERLRAPALSCIGALGLGLGAAMPELRVAMAFVAHQVEWASDEFQERSAMGAEDPWHGNLGASAPLQRPVKTASGSAARRRGKPVPAKVEHQRDLRRAVLDAVLEAYEEIVRGYQRTQSLRMLAEFLPGILEFACRYAGASGSEPKTMRAALRLLHALATEFPSELLLYVQRTDAGRASVSRIVCFGASCPSPKLRDLAAPLARLAEQPAGPAAPGRDAMAVAGGSC